MCDNGTCVRALARSYRVILVGANLPPESQCGWLDSCDPFAVVTFATRGSERIVTPTANNTLSPTWNKELISASPSELTTSAIKVEIIDDDLAFDKRLGTCQVVATREEVIAGSTSRQCRAEGFSFHLNFSYRPVDG
jgi:hypothetical protein